MRLISIAEYFPELYITYDNLLKYLLPLEIYEYGEEGVIEEDFHEDKIYGDMDADVTFDDESTIHDDDSDDDTINNQIVEVFD